MIEQMLQLCQKKLKKGKGKVKWSLKLLQFNSSGGLGIGFGVSSKSVTKGKNYTFDPNSGNGLHYFLASDGFSFYQDCDLSKSAGYITDDPKRGQIGDVIDLCVDCKTQKLSITNKRSQEVREFDIKLPVYPSVFLNYTGDSIEILTKK